MQVEVMLGGAGGGVDPAGIGLEAVEGDLGRLPGRGGAAEAGDGELAAAGEHLGVQTVEAGLAGFPDRDGVQGAGLQRALGDQLVAALLWYTDELLVQGGAVDVAELNVEERGF